MQHFRGPDENRHWGLKVSGGDADDVGMANTGKHITPRRPSTEVVTAAPDGSLSVGERLPPRIEVLRKLVADGQYMVSPRYLAYRIFRAAGIPVE